MAEAEDVAEVSQAALARVTALEGEGKTVMLVAVDGVVVALVAVADRIKTATPEAVAALRRLGLKVWMITGDNPRCAAAIAKQAGIDSNHVMAEVKRPLCCAMCALCARAVRVARERCACVCSHHLTVHS